MTRTARLGHHPRSALSGTADRVENGVLCAMSAYAIFPVGDAVIKSLWSSFPGTGLAAIRYGFGTVIVGISSCIRSPQCLCPFPLSAVQSGRGVAVSMATTMFFVALQFMQLGEARMILYLNPVLIVLLSSALHAQFLISPVATVSSSAAALIGHLSGIEQLKLSLPPRDVLVACTIAAALAMTAHGLLFMAKERAAAGRIAPSACIQLLAAITLGVLVFGDQYDVLKGVGAVLIVAAGLICWRTHMPRSVIADPE